MDPSTHIEQLGVLVLAVWSTRAQFYRTAQHKSLLSMKFRPYKNRITNHELMAHVIFRISKQQLKTISSGPMQQLEINLVGNPVSCLANFRA